MKLMDMAGVHIRLGVTNSCDHCVPFVHNESPSQKSSLGPLKIYWCSFFVCFQSFTETRMFASSLSCCSSFTLVLSGTKR